MKKQKLKKATTYQMDQSGKVEKIGSPRLFVNITFASLICLLIDKQTKNIIIDLEYPGHNKTLTSMIKTVYPEVKITWKRIGKSSNAHDIAYKTYKGKLKSGKKVNANEVWRVVKKIAGERLSTGVKPAGRRPAPTINKNYTKKPKKVKK